MKLSASVIVFGLVYGVSCAPEPLRGYTQAGADTSTSVNGTHLSISGEAQLSYDSGLVSFFAARRHLNFGANSTVPVASHRPLKTSVSEAERHRHHRHHHHGRWTDLKSSTHAYASASGHNKYAGSRTSAGTGHGAEANLKSATKVKVDKRAPQPSQALNLAPTPAPTASGSSLTTVHVNDEDDFALLLPKNPNELISDAETDATVFCTSTGCANTAPGGFVTAAAVSRAPDNSSWIQVTGCIDPTKISLSSSDDGGQFDVRFPNGAQCTFGGYGASFIEQVEPSANRFCLRCCANSNDQTNCNSHQDRAGCPIAIPGVYDFPDKGVSCA
ncbi:hypothetical protein DFH11DRAFT_1623356 [Phellopilus nigrolimitatus]|nr:hypothetical protein DFH11DRAFT_1623356 [Phellopilus nigrolimitatus]